MYDFDNYMVTVWDIIIKELNIYEWEIQYWENKINDKNYELYYADIDTTFCLIDKTRNNDITYTLV